VKKNERDDINAAVDKKAARKTLLDARLDRSA
jgi:hypothetical protein